MSNTSSWASKLAVHLGMLVCGIAFSGWYAQHTILDTSRTERVATTVLSDPTVRDFLAGEILPAIVLASPSTAAALAAPSGYPSGVATVNNISAQDRLANVLADPGIETELSRFVGDVHRRVIGVGSGPVTLDKAAIDRLVTAAVPTVAPDELARIQPVSVDVPQATPLMSIRHAVADHWWLIGLAGVALVAAGLFLTTDRPGAVKVIGKWLIGLSLVQLVVLWFVPVWVVPAVTDNVWARVVSKVARALNGGVVVGLFVIAGLGIALLFVDPVVERVFHRSGGRGS